MQGFDQHVGPIAEDFDNTFRFTKNNDRLYTLDGVALGLGIELLDRIKKLEETLSKSTALGENYGN